MTATAFYRLLLLVVGISTIAYQIIAMNVPALVPSQDFFWLLQFFYSGLCVGFFYLGNTALRSKNINLFSQIIILFILTKLVFSIMLFVSYSLIRKPIGTAHIIPFIISYLIFTVFGTYFLGKIGRSKQKS